MENESLLSFLINREMAADVDTLKTWIQAAREGALTLEAQSMPKIEAVGPPGSKRLAGTQTAFERNGVAIIPIQGPIFPQSNIFTYYFGGVGMDTLSADFTSAVKNPDIRSIVFHVNSGGGVIFGVNEFSNAVFAARGIKPTATYVAGFNGSAAYWISSATDIVVCDATAMLGSIGVAMAMTRPDRSEVEIISSQSPYKRSDPANEKDRERAQATVDSLADVFIATVARNRGKAIKQVKADYGKGDMLVGVHAVNAGLADRIGSLESVIAELSSSEVSATVKPSVSATQERIILDGASSVPHNTAHTKARSPLMSWFAQLMGREATAAEKQRMIAELQDGAPEGEQTGVSPVSAGVAQPQIGAASPPATATFLTPGVPALSAKDREELDRYRSNEATRAVQAATDFGKTKARTLLKDGHIEASQEGNFAAAFECLYALQNNSAITADSCRFTFKASDEKGNDVTGTTTVADFFAAALENKPTAKWSEELLTDPVGVSALFNRTQTTERKPDAAVAEANDTLVDEMLQFTRAAGKKKAA